MRRAFCLALALGWGLLAGSARPALAGAPAGKKGKLVKLKLPAAARFKTPDGKTGWKLKIPGGRPLATPAVAGGVIYVGGGFGSHEFYAIDAKTGKAVWTYRTGDDGPTAAVVDEGCVAYNTESCTIYVHEARTGKLLWHRWLGDPLMSQPAIADGRVFMAWPGKGGHRLGAFALRTGKKLWEKKIASEVITAPVIEGQSVYAATTDGTVYRFGAKDGKQYWKLACKATSAPRIWKGQVLISQRAEKTVEAAKDPKAKKVKSKITLEGFNAIDPAKGTLAYKQPQAAVKAAYLLSYGRAQRYGGGGAAVVGAGVYGYRHAGGRARRVLRFSGSSSTETRKLDKDITKFIKERPEAPDAKAGQADAERALALAGRLDKVAAKTKDAKRRKELAALAAEMRKTAESTRDAAQLAGQIKKSMAALKAEHESGKKHDASVGFATAPVAAKIGAAEENIGQAGVKAVWAYQGSRPAMAAGRVYCINGDRMRSLAADFKKTHWDQKIKSKVKATRPATPPALGGGKFYVGTADGRILCIEPKSGKKHWESEVGGSILFEPAVVGGRVYAATSDGTLICLETGDAEADGWSMWGGSAKHNGPEKKKAK